MDRVEKNISSQWSKKVRTIIIKNCSVESRETLNEKHWKGIGYIGLSV
jgi:hypothetical protein